MEDSSGVVQRRRWLISGWRWQLTPCLQQLCVQGPLGGSSHYDIIDLLALATLHGECLVGKAQCPGKESMARPRGSPGAFVVAGAGVPEFSAGSVHTVALLQQ